MDKHSKCSLYRLRMALAISIAFCFTTDIFAQATSTTDSTAIATPDTVGELTNGLNTVWMLLAAMLVFFMQPGFALVEAGFTRVKNTANILMKNFVDFMFGSLLYWFIGFGLQCRTRKITGSYKPQPRKYNTTKSNKKLWTNIVNAVSTDCVWPLPYP